MYDVLENSQVRLNVMHSIPSVERNYGRVRVSVSEARKIFAPACEWKNIKWIYNITSEKGTLECDELR